MTVSSTIARRSRARIDAAEAEQALTAEQVAEAERAAQSYAMTALDVDIDDKAEAERRKVVYAVIAEAAHAEARRIPASLRIVAAPDDIATDTLLTLAESDAGRRVLVTLTREGRRATASIAHVRMTAKRTVSDMLRRETVAAPVEAALRRSAITTAEALTAPHTARTVEAPSAPLNGRSGAERDAVKAALEQDGATDRPDRDMQRALGMTQSAAHGYASGKLLAWNANTPRSAEAEALAGSKAERSAVKAERRKLPVMLEQGAFRSNEEAARGAKDWSLSDGRVVGRQIRLLRGPDLAALLDQSLHVHADRTGEDASGRSGNVGMPLTAHVSDKQARGAFREALREALTRTVESIKCRGIQSLRGAVEALTALDADDATERARRFIDSAQTERRIAEALRAEAPAYRRGLTQAERTARDAATTAERSAERAEALAGMAQSLAATRRGYVTTLEAPETVPSFREYVRLYGRPLADIAERHRQAGAVAYLLGDTKGGAKALALAATAERIAERRAVEAPYVHGVRAEAAHRDNGRPLDLLDVIEAALAGTVDNGRDDRKRGATGGARKRAERAEAPDASAIDASAVLAYLAPLSIDTAARALSTVMTTARETALDACIMAPCREAHHDAAEAEQASNVEAHLVRLAYGRRLLAERRAVEAQSKRTAHEAQRAEAEAHRAALAEQAEAEALAYVKRQSGAQRRRAQRS